MESYIVPEELFSYQRSAQRSSYGSGGFLLENDKRLFDVRCFDISQQGIGIISPVPLQTGKHVYLRVSQPLTQGYVYEGRICWCNKERDGWHAGVELHKPIPFDLGKLIP